MADHNLIPRRPVGWTWDFRATGGWWTDLYSMWRTGGPLPEPWATDHHYAAPLALLAVLEQAKQALRNPAVETIELPARYWIDDYDAISLGPGKPSTYWTYLSWAMRWPELSVHLGGDLRGSGIGHLLAFASDGCLVGACVALGEPDHGRVPVHPHRATVADLRLRPPTRAEKLHWLRDRLESRIEIYTSRAMEGQALATWQRGRHWEARLCRVIQAIEQLP